MDLIKVVCSTCKKTYLRTAGRVNEAKKFGWKQYCSKECQNQAQTTRVEKVCGNSNCNKRTLRELSQFKQSKSGLVFCSSSCAAIFNNSSRKKLKACPVCSKQFYGERKYCSKTCRSKTINPLKKSESERQKGVLDKIKAFYKTNGRIPTKKEKPGLARRARVIFSTWNKAIKAAGYKPNPIMFSRKFIAKDGHVCDSFSEKIIDDWFYKTKIKHKRRIPYPENKTLTADFMVGNNWIEYFGLANVINDYDLLIKKKQMLSKKYKLSLIEIYPEDLFPVNRLSEIIKIKKLVKNNKNP